MNAIPNMPAVYRAPVGGPKTIAWMRAKGWIDRRTVTRTHDAPGR